MTAPAGMVVYGGARIQAIPGDSGWGTHCAWLEAEAGEPPSNALIGIAPGHLWDETEPPTVHACSPSGELLVRDLGQVVMLRRPRENPRIAEDLCAYTPNEHVGSPLEIRHTPPGIESAGESVDRIPSLLGKWIEPSLRDLPIATDCEVICEMIHCRGQLRQLKSFNIEDDKGRGHDFAELIELHVDPSNPLPSWCDKGGQSGAAVLAASNGRWALCGMVIGHVGNTLYAMPATIISDSLVRAGYRLLLPVVEVF